MKEVIEMYYSENNATVALLCRTDPNFTIACGLIYDRLGDFSIIQVSPKVSRLSGDLKWFIKYNQPLPKSLKVAWKYIEKLIYCKSMYVTIRKRNET